MCQLVEEGRRVKLVCSGPREVIIGKLTKGLKVPLFFFLMKFSEQGKQDPV